MRCQRKGGIALLLQSLRVSWPPSLSLGRRPHRAMRAVLLIPVLLLPLAACTHRQYVQPAASTIGNKVTSEAQAIAIVREDIQRRGPVAAVAEIGSYLASGAHEFKASFFRHRRLALFGASHLYSRRWPGSKIRHYEV